MGREFPFSRVSELPCMRALELREYQYCSPQPPLLWAEQIKGLHMLLMHPSLYTLPHLQSPTLSTL